MEIVLNSGRTSGDGIVSSVDLIKKQVKYFGRTSNFLLSGGNSG